jgi:diadenosine tetraphosphate (Ap4A) HIT family hydrolase
MVASPSKSRYKSQMSFTLHKQLAADTIHVIDLAVCRVLLMNNQNFPWLILVPMRADLREIYDLNDVDHEIAMGEIREITKIFSELTGADKMNVATLGNVVSQLHIHIIARFKNDLAFPKPVWNSEQPAVPYSPEQSEEMVRKLRDFITSSSRACHGI